MLDLTGRVVVITGASSGIGAAAAIECARAGMDCVINGRRTEPLEDVARAIEWFGRRAIIVGGDVREPGMAARLLDAAQREFGGFHVVFANAGFGIERGMLDTPMEQVREIFEVNFFAGLELLREAAVRLMEQRRPGHLLMCASCLSKFSFPTFGAYAATKAAQTQVCTAMRAELAPRGIHVSAVCPIVTRTAFFRAIARRDGRRPVGDNLPDYCPDFLVQEPQAVAQAIVRCLRRPKPEVWTSAIMRAFASLVTLWPAPLEAAMRRHVARQARTPAPERAPRSPAMAKPRDCDPWASSEPSVTRLNSP